MASVNNNLSPFDTNDTMRDYTHASRTFVDNNFELQPRHGHLFHVVFEFTAEAAGLFNTIEKLELPILVKSVSLPSYAIDVQTHNQYNRQVQTHHRISYNPVTVRFHDDVKELIRNLWHKYYVFYSADPTYSLDSNSYNTQDRYANRTQEQWGLQRGAKRFFKNIKIYSMHNHKFAEYTLINPIITAFNHDNHDYARADLMEHTMSINYETVKYATGFVNNTSPAGFGEIHYDVETSDLSNGDQSGLAFINGQLVNTNGQSPNDLFNATSQATINEQGTFFDNLTDISIGGVISTALGKVANNLLTGQKPTSNILVPFIGKAGQRGENIKNAITNNIIKSVTNYGTNDTISSQGQSIGNATYTSTPSSPSNSGIGFANLIPNSNGSVGSSNKISDTVEYQTSSTSSNTRQAQLQGIKSRLSTPNLPENEKTYLEERLRLLKL